MAGNLVIVESPAKAGTIQKFLGEDYVVKSSYGHIRDLHKSKLSVDVDNNFEPHYVIPSDKKKIVSELKKLASKADTVWLASDEDREGEAISWHLAQALKLNENKTKRIVFHEITKPAIINAIKNPRKIDMNLVDAQQARRVLDRLVGFELSPILWRKIQPKLSAGRVQSVALRLVVDREREIINFERKPYYNISGIFNPSDADKNIKVKATLDKRFDGFDAAKQFLEDCKNAEFSVVNVDRKKGKRNPAAPFTTSTLQQEASRKLRFPVNLTMSIAQQLYESGLITYMRTDSTNLSGLAINKIKEVITNMFGENYSKCRQYRTKSKGAQEAHEAIRPTFPENSEIEGSPQQKKLYDLIWKRTMASQMANADVLRTNIKVASDKRDEIFNIRACRVLFDGFLKLYIEGTDDPQDEYEEAILPEINVGDKMNPLYISGECKFTNPPSRYSEATLVKKLEELGIGRPSTYAPIITTLTKERGYINKGNKKGKTVKVTNLMLKDGKITETEDTQNVGSEKGRLIPQDIGIIVTDFLVENFKTVLNYNFTAKVEKDFDKIAEGKLEWNDVIASFYSPFHTKVEETLADENYYNVERKLGKDPETGKPVVAKFGKYGPYLQRGEGEKKEFVSLPNNLLIESVTMEEALKLFRLPRTVGKHNGKDIIATKGRYGPYLKYDNANYSLPRDTDPITIKLDECVEIIRESIDRKKNSLIMEFKTKDIKVINGRYGPYIKHDGGNYKIPKSVEADKLTLEKCLEIIETTKPSGKKYRRKKSNK